MRDLPASPNVQGFTLLEMMVVILILAIAASTTMFSVAGIYGRKDEAFARSLGNKFQHAWEWSRVAHQSLRILSIDNQIRIEHWTDQGWQASNVYGLNHKSSIPEDMEISLESGFSTDTVLTILAGGTYSPFELLLHTGSEDFAIVGDGQNPPSFRKVP